MFQQQMISAFSSMLKTRVISKSEYDDLKQRDPEAARDAQVLSLCHLYEHTYKWGQLGEGGGAVGGDGEGDRIQVS